jgi:phosphoadenosine phosphosulfate reductase
MRSDSWPPGGSDPQIEALAADFVSPAGALDLAGLLESGRAGRTALVSSFGTEAAVLLHLVAEACPGLPVLFLDTGKHFPETLAYRDTLVERFGLTNVVALRPSEATLADEDPGGDLWRRDPDACCMLRKTFPLQDALDGFDSWITGRKRYHGGARSVLPYFERDGAHLKINPLIHLDAAAISAYFERHDIPRHPLLEKGYLSVGCSPCTKPVATGQPARAGRWDGLDKVECGIHLGPDGRFVRRSRN